MIRANHIVEEYETAFKINKEYIEIFSNPSRQEMRDLGDVIRFVAHGPTKKLYVWDAYLAMHNEILYRLGLTKSWDKIDYLKGTAKSEGGHYDVTILTFGELGGELLRQLCKKDWSWTTTYGIDLKMYLRVHKPGQSK